MKKRLRVQNSHWNWRREDALVSGCCKAVGVGGKCVAKLDVQCVRMFAVTVSLESYVIN